MQQNLPARQASSVKCQASSLNLPEKCSHVVTEDDLVLKLKRCEYIFERNIAGIENNTHIRRKQN